jgi:hypothetical protein
VEQLTRENQSLRDRVKYLEGMIECYEADSIRVYNTQQGPAKFFVSADGAISKSQYFYGAGVTSNFRRTGPVQFRLGVLNATDDYRIDNAFTIHRRPVHFNSRLGFAVP